MNDSDPTRNDSCLPIPISVIRIRYIMEYIYVELDRISFVLRVNLAVELPAAKPRLSKRFFRCCAGYRGTSREDDRHSRDPSPRTNEAAYCCGESSSKPRFAGSIPQARTARL